MLQLINFIVQSSETKRVECIAARCNVFLFGFVGLFSDLKVLYSQDGRWSSNYGLAILE
jgi:hypothetical protein